MKKHIKTIVCLLFTAALALSFCACFSPWAEDETGITLNLGDDPGDRAITQWPPPDVEQQDIEYTIDITDTFTGIAIPTIIYQGTGTVYVKLEPGFYDVDIIAHHNLQLCAEFHSPAPIEVKKGKNNPVKIIMDPAIGLTFTVTFDADGGTPAPGSMTLPLNSPISPPVGVTRSIDALAGWFTEPAFINKWDFVTDMVTRDMTLHAKWVSGYTITYTMNGGGTHSNPTIYTTDDLPITTLADATGYTGYTFGGWFDNVGLTGTAVTSIPAGTTGNLDLYAKWNPITYYVSYNSNGGTGTMANSTHTYDSSSNLTANGFTPPTGATFAGWAISATDSVAYSNSASVSNLTTTDGDTFPLYARWQYTVTFNTNGGSPSTYPSVQVLSGSTISSPGTPTRTWNLSEGLYSGSSISTSGNYSISSWSVGSPGGTVFTFGTTTVNGSITLYTNWSGGPPGSLATGIANAVTYVNGTAGAYTYWCTGGSIFLAPQTLSNSGTSLYLQGSSTTTIGLSSQGSLFNITGGYLYLNANIILDGYNGNNAPLVKITNGTLSMTGSTIRNNITSSASIDGAGVYVDTGGTLTMNSGSFITQNRGGSGVGVYVQGTFNLGGGTISNNEYNSMFGGSFNGGGVLVDNGGQFTMTSGNITGNSVNGGGGGVGIGITGTTSEFTMIGGNISGNSADIGGGVAVKLYQGGIFTKTGGTISGNTATGTDTQPSNHPRGNSVGVYYNSPVPPPPAPERDYINGTVGASDSIGWNNGTRTGTLWND